MQQGRPQGDSAEEVVRLGDHFYVLAASPRADDRTRILKHDDTLGVFHRTGDILALGMGDQGVFHRGTRHLSRLDLSVGGSRPLLLSSSPDRENLALAVDMTNPDVTDRGSVLVQRGVLHILRLALIWNGTLHQCLRLHNFGLTPVHFRLVVRFEADFADMFEVRGVQRQRHGRMFDPALIDGMVELKYEGLDGVTRTTRVSCEPAPDLAGPDRIELDIHLNAGQERTIEVRFACAGSDAPPPGNDQFSDAIAHSRERARAFLGRQCEVSTSHPHFNEWLARSRADLLLMTTTTPDGPYPYAGVPWFSTPFGRDGIITALETLWMDPETSRGVIAFLSATQAKGFDPKMDAEPGKIVHEIRTGEMAAVGEVPYARYYGSVDATPLYIMLAGEYLRSTGDGAFIASHWPCIRAALEWIDRHGDIDHDGFVEYAAKTSEGLSNQGWKDSRDSVFHEDGTFANPPVALSEVQGYVYAAKRAAAEIAEFLGETADAAALNHQAEELRDRFGTAFWDDQLGMYVLALDGSKRPCRVAASNAGQCLYTGIAREDHAARMIEDLVSPRFFSGWGIRTVASDQPRYNPMSYHNGSIWPHDTALIGAGMARYNRADAAARLLEALFDVARTAELHRMPELYCGFARRRDEGPVRYPVACSPQSWAAGSVFLLLQACLGLTVRGDRREVLFANTVLPEFLEFVRLRGLRVGPCSVDLVLERSGTDINVHILHRDPGVRVILTK